MMNDHRPIKMDRLRHNATSRADMSDETYIEIVRLLLSALLASGIMALAFACLAGVIWAEVRHPLIAILGVIGTVAGIARTVFLAAFRKIYPEGTRTALQSRNWETAYGVLSFTFAIVLGAFCAVTLSIGPPSTHLLATGLLFGYCSGIVARVSIRSWIAIPCVLFAALPMIGAALLHHEGEYRTFAAFLSLILAGGLESARFVARSAVAQIAMQREFAALARHDDLTGLPNRLALRKHFEDVATSERLHRIAVHCLDLDRFKPVNDRYGHPVGDALLQAVAGRLEGLLRAGDLAVRVGGDEFVILQADVDHTDQADMLARRIQRDLSTPYMIDDHQIMIGASVGYAISPDDGRTLEQLIACADAALYRVKRRGGGIAACGDLSDEIDAHVAV